MSVIDYGGTNRALAEFDEKHGACFVRDGRVFYEDGAMREQSAFGLLVEPPTDPYDRARRIAFYWKHVFEKAVSDFDAGKQYLVNVCGGNLGNSICGPAPEPGALVELRARHKVALDAKKNYDKAMKALEAVKPREVAEREIGDQHNREYNQKVLSELNAISI
ncbi:MAG: hypothetical protein ABSB42_02515 [Tepidisphaeraceae bacterium]|jgi:hypothetical protein